MTVMLMMVTNLWLDKFQRESLVLDVGPVDADLHHHRVKHVQHDATGCLCAFLTIQPSMRPVIRPFHSRTWVSRLKTLTGSRNVGNMRWRATDQEVDQTGRGERCKKIVKHVN